MTILSKRCKQDNFEPHNSLKLSFTNIRGLCSKFVRQTIWGKLGWFYWFWQFLCQGLFSFNPKQFCYSYAWSCSLCERRTSFCTGFISRKLCGFLFMFLTSFTSLSVILLFPLSITFFVVMLSFWFYLI